MKYLSIVAFLAVVVFFTVWSLYEDERKRVIREDFSAELLGWVVQDKGSEASFSFSKDTLTIANEDSVTLWYDRKFAEGYALNYSIFPAVKSTVVLRWGGDPFNEHTSGDTLRLALLDGVWNRIQLRISGDSAVVRVNDRIVRNERALSTGYAGFTLSGEGARITDVTIRIDKGK